MFDNLIESSSHLTELKRRGSFFLFTVVSYALLFVIAGVASIYAYDARMEDQSLEVVFVPALDFPESTSPTGPPQGAPGNSSPGREPASHRQPQSQMASVNQPITPDFISIEPNLNPLIPGGPSTSGPADPFSRGGGGGPESGGISPGGGNAITSARTTIDIETPPPAPQKPKAVVVSKGPITGEALLLPKPEYPGLARQIKLQGQVNVQVLIDETGKVISAQAIDGHQVFREVARNAALKAIFRPTKLGDQFVKVTGVITYNFVLQ